MRGRMINLRVIKKGPRLLITGQPLSFTLTVCYWVVVPGVSYWLEVIRLLLVVMVFMISFLKPGPWLLLIFCIQPHFIFNMASSLCLTSPSTLVQSSTHFTLPVLLSPPPCLTPISDNTPSSTLAHLALFYAICTPCTP
jgi:hypothetical protein